MVSAKRSRIISAVTCPLSIVWLCIYTVLKTGIRRGLYNADYGTVHYKEPLKSFEIRVGHSTGFGLCSVAILSRCAESDVKQYWLAVHSCSYYAILHKIRFGWVKYIGLAWLLDSMFACMRLASCNYIFDNFRNKTRVCSYNQFESFYHLE